MTLATEQIGELARRIAEEADGRTHRSGEAHEHVQLWEAVRHACHAVGAVVDLERGELDGGERGLRARYLVSELETALDSARRARTALSLRDRVD